MKKFIPLILFVMFACETQAAPRHRYSAAEARALLEHLATHVMVINSDMTLSRKAPSNTFDLVTHYPLPKDKAKAYERNGHIAHQDDDLAEIVTYRIKDYALTNEKNEALRLRDGGGDGSLQDFALWTYDKVLSGQLGLAVKLDKRFERVKGHMTMVLEIPGKLTREVRVPVDLSITDKDPRPGT